MRQQVREAAGNSLSPESTQRTRLESGRVATRHSRVAGLAGRSTIENIIPPSLFIAPRGAQEPSRHFQQRIEATLEPLNHLPIGEENARAIFDGLGSWRRRLITNGDGTMDAFHLPSRVETADTEHFSTERRSVLKVGGGIVAFVRELYGEDVLALLELQKTLESPSPWAQQFTQTQYELLRILDKPRSVIARELETTENCVAARIRKIRLRAGCADKYELMLLAHEHGDLPFSDVPSGTTLGLSLEEKRHIRAGYKTELEKLGKKQGVCGKTAYNRWVRIYEKTGSADRHDLICRAMKDGVIAPPKPRTKA